jgi:hypothetical protein
MELFFYLVLGTGAGSLIGWLASTLVQGGEWKNRLSQVEKLAHASPCPDLSDIKGDIKEIKNDLAWLKKRNGG